MKAFRFVVIAAVMMMALGLTMQNLQAEEAVEAPAAPAEEVKTVVTHGSVKSVDAKTGNFVLTVKGKNADAPATDVTVTVNPATQYKLDGKPSTKELVVKVGAAVKAQQKNGVTIKVEGHSPKAADSAPAPEAPAEAPVEAPAAE